MHVAIDAERSRKGLRELGFYLVPDFNSETEDSIHEFSWRMCDCCRSRLGGTRHRFAVLAEGPEPE